jgi:hypothetical protein
VALFTIVGLLIASGAGAQTYDPHDLSGVWVQQDKAPRFRTLLSYTPEYAKILDAHLEALKAGKPYRHDGGQCLPSGLIGMMTAGSSTYPLEIFQSGTREVAMSMESTGALFRIFLDRGHKPADEQFPHFFGDNVGRWEGDVLVVDSIDLGKMESLGDQVSPSSPDMHVVQRLRRTSFNTLENELTMDDPKALTKPFTLTIHYKLDPKGELDEVTCDNERVLYDAQGNTHIAPAN